MKAVGIVLGIVTLGILAAVFLAAPANASSNDSGKFSQAAWWGDNPAPNPTPTPKPTATPLPCCLTVDGNCIETDEPCPSTPCDPSDCQPDNAYSGGRDPSTP